MYGLIIAGAGTTATITESSVSDIRHAAIAVTGARRPNCEATRSTMPGLASSSSAPARRRRWRTPLSPRWRHPASSPMAAQCSSRRGRRQTRQTLPTDHGGQDGNRSPAASIASTLTIPRTSASGKVIGSCARQYRSGLLFNSAEPFRQRVCSMKAVERRDDERPVPHDDRSLDQRAAMNDGALAVLGAEPLGERASARRRPPTDSRPLAELDAGRARRPPPEEPSRDDGEKAPGGHFAAHGAEGVRRRGRCRPAPTRTGGVRRHARSRRHGPNNLPDRYWACTNMEQRGSLVGRPFPPAYQFALEASRSGIPPNRR